MSEHLATHIVNALQRIADALETLAAEATERQAVERARRRQLLGEYAQLRSNMYDAVASYDTLNDVNVGNESYWRGVDARAERAEAAALAFEEKHPEIVALAEAEVA